MEVTESLLVKLQCTSYFIVLQWAALDHGGASAIVADSVRRCIDLGSEEIVGCGARCVYDILDMRILSIGPLSV